MHPSRCTSTSIAARVRPLGLLLLVAAAAVHAAPAPVAVGGPWTGSVVRARRRETFAGRATLAQRGAQVTGWLELNVPDMASAVPVTGAAKPRAVVLQGTAGETRVRWVARWRAKHGELRGKLRVRGPGGKMKGVLALHREDRTAPSCGGDYFRDTVMPDVLVPVCAQCHVPGGLAELTTFRVTRDDPAATAASAATHVDASAPLSSRLIRKPRGELSHGGGVQLEAGSARDDVLVQWIEQIADCTGGGGGGGGEQTGARLYADHCAGCHGADAGGRPGGAGERTRPDIRCASRVADAVTTGRGDAMPPIPELDTAAIAKIAQHLDALCTEEGRTGAALFASNCVTCHGSDARGATSALGVAGTHIRCHRSIADSVQNGLGDMPAFPGLDAADVVAIGDFLVGLCPSAGAGGDELYASNCARCHGNDASGRPGEAGERTRPDVRCATRVADAVTTGRGDAMPPIPALDTLAIAKIEQHLDALCTEEGRTGAALFASNCVTCHGSDARGATNALGVAGTHIRCHRSIADSVQNGLGEMPAFPGLDAADVDAIGDVLVGLCPIGSAGGDELYASNCARCHGDDAGGLPAPAGERRRPAIRCSTAPRIDDALSLGRADAMPSFARLFGIDRSALSDFLEAACTQAGRPPSDLYDGNCATCHGVTGGGGRNALGVDGPEIRCTESGDFSEKIMQGEDDMPAFPELVPDAAAIAAWVRATSCRDD